MKTCSCTLAGTGHCLFCPNSSIFIMDKDLEKIIEKKDKYKITTSSTYLY